MATIAAGMLPFLTSHREVGDANLTKAEKPAATGRHKDLANLLNIH